MKQKYLLFFSLIWLVHFTNAQTICGTGQVSIRYYTGYAIDFTTSNSVTNAARAIGIINTNRFAVLVHNANVNLSGQIVLTLADLVPSADTIKIIQSGIDASSVAYQVSVSADNVSYSPVTIYSVSGTVMQTNNYIVSWPAGAKYVKIKCNSTTKDLRLDAVSYIKKQCMANCMSGTISYSIGNGTTVTVSSTGTNLSSANGNPDNASAIITNAQQLVIDLGLVVPFGTKIQCYLASPSATTAVPFTVSSSLSNTTYSDNQNFSAKILQPDFAASTYVVNQTTGVRYLKFSVTGALAGYIDATTFQFPTYWGKNYINGFAFSDINLNGVKDGLETGAAGINVKLYKDINNNHLFDVNDVFKQSANTSVGGSYQFQITQNDTNYIVTVAPNTFPSGFIPGTATYRSITFTSLNQTSCSQDFGYISCTGNCPPIAADDYTTTSNGASIYIPVLSNDYDPNNNIDPASLTIIRQPTQGTLLQSGTQLIYSPIGSFFGLDTITYVISDLTPGTPLSDTANVIITVLSTISTVCDNAVLTHSFYIPAQENNIRKAFGKMQCTSPTALSDSMKSIISIKVPYPGCKITFDHWEDGYEPNSNTPQQTSTQVWGDANIYNGIAPGYPTDVIPAGASIVLSNMVCDTFRNAAFIKYDAGDKIISNEDIAISRIAWDKNRSGLQTYSTDVYDAGRFGTDFIVPMGQDINATRDFQYTGLFIRANKNNTTISIDKNSDNIVDITATLNEGQEYFVNGGIMFGASVAASKPIGVDMIFGDTTDCYNSKTLNLIPAVYYSNSYLTPVPTTHAPDSCAVMFYNPVNTPITITWNTQTGSGSFIVNGQGYKRFNLDQSTTSGYKFTSASGKEFVANELIDAWSVNPATNSGATYNWAFSLLPPTRLTNFFAIAWAPGSTDGTQNGSPVWVMPENNTTIYVKYDGNLSQGGNASPCGFMYDVSYSLNSLGYKKLFDNSDKDQSGMAVYTCDGTKIVGVYGEDPATAGVATPYLDAGTSIQPLCAERRVFANDDYATTTVNQPVSIQVTNNDAGWLTTLDYNSVTTAGQLQALHGVVTVYPGGVISYQPDSGYIGLDTFQYNICSIDVSLLCDNALVCINVTGCGVGLNQVNLSGQVFFDVNKNGVADDFAGGIANVKVRLYLDLNCNGNVNNNDLLLDSTLTNSSGSFQFLRNPEHTFADNFDNNGATTCTTGTDGTDAWTNNWTFSGLVNSNCTASNFSSDDVITVIDNGDYSLRVKDNNKSATRSFNMSGATQAYLSFNFRRGTAFPNTSNVKVQISTNNGSSYTTIYTISGTGAIDAAYTAINNLNITSYASSNNIIRILTSAALGDANYVYIDDVVIRFLKYPMCFITKLDNTTVPSNYSMTTASQFGYTASASGCASTMMYGVKWNYVTISGKILDDGNGLTDNQVNGINITTIAGNPVYAYLVDQSNNVVFKDTVVSGGAWILTGSENTNYKVVLSLTNVSVGMIAPSSSSLPSGWVDVGDSYGLHNSAGTGVEAGSPNLQINVNTGLQNVTVMRFGVEQLPNPVSSALAPQLNPGGTNQISITNMFTGTDVDGNISQIHFISFPSNVTSITIGGTLYTSATFPLGGVTVSNGTAVSIDPVNGAVTCSVPFKVLDNAGKESLNAASADIPLTDIFLTGTFFNDGNGLTDNTVNGTGTNASGQVYLTLISGNTIVGVTPADASGAYTFSTSNGLTGNAVFSIVATTNPAGSLTPIMPAGWAAIGENLGAGSGNDGLVDGILVVNMGLVNVANANLSGDKIPVPQNATQTVQVNPGNGTLVPVSSSLFTATDADGIITSIKITSFPSNSNAISINGITYTSSSFPVGGVSIPASSNGNPLQNILVDPIDGAITVHIIFSATDNAGVVSQTNGDVSIPFSDITLTGTVFNDPNGDTNGLIDGTPINNPSLTSLYAVLVKQSTGLVVGNALVKSSGNYQFSTANGLEINTNYRVVLRNAPPGIIGQTVTPQLPTGWVNTGEGQTGTGDGNPDGMYNVSVAMVNVTNVNYGIEILPLVNTTTEISRHNPGGNTFVNVLPTDFNGNDIDGILNQTIKITSFPSNTDAIKVDNVVYTISNFPLLGVIVNANLSGNPTQNIQIDPINGAVTVSIPYKTIDNANRESLQSASVNIPFTDFTISGTVFDDANGTYNGLIDGVPTGTPSSQQLFANLINHNTGLVSGVVPVNANGTYTISTLNGIEINKTYDVAISTLAGTVGQTVTTTLPTGWVNTAEGLTNPGDGLVNGKTLIAVDSTNISNINFGIEQIPNSFSAAEALQLNPGGTNNVLINPTDFSGTDADGIVDTIHIISFPTNANTLTVNGVIYSAISFPVGGVFATAAANGNPTQTISVDPIDGTVTVSINYTTRDNAGKESTASTVQIPFVEIILSGVLYDDGNGINNSQIDGTGNGLPGGIQMYALLVNHTTGLVAGSVPVQTNGSYSIGALQGIKLNTGFDIEMSSTNTAAGLTPVITLPSNQWVTTHEGLTGLGDGTPNSITFVQVNTSSVSNINFGIDKRPTANNATNQTRPNPGGTNYFTVPSTLFTGTDFEGTVEFIRISSFPPSTTSLNVNGTVYNPSTFPAGGILIPCNASGNPLQTIKVDPSYANACTITISFFTRDSAGKESLVAGVVTLPFTITP